MAAAYREKKDWVQAYLNMQQAVNLAPANSPDKNRVLKELEEIKAKLPKAPQQATPAAQLKKEERLVAPSPIPTPKPGFSNITLPEEAAPEIPEEASPLPSPSPTGSPQATSSPTGEANP